MRRIAPYLLIGLCTLACNHKDKEAPPPSPPAQDQPVQTGKYSAAFGLALDTLMQGYFQMIEGFAAGDTAGVDKAGTTLLTRVDTMSFADFQKDTIVFQTAVQQRGNLANEAKGLLGDRSLVEKRKDLNMVSQDLYDLLRTVRYDRSKIYFTQCPTALGDENPGYWVGQSADTTSTLNPYLGHSALHCAQIMDSLPAHP
jgi:hypothetical protein